jgi:hypothetical protein
MLTLIELIQVKKKHGSSTLACKGDTLPALRVWIHNNLAGFLTPTMIFAFSKCHYIFFDGPYTQLETNLSFFRLIFSVFEEKSLKSYC